jgi:hypothetical protein
MNLNTPPRAIDRQPAGGSALVNPKLASRELQFAIGLFHFLIRRVTASTSQKSAGKSWLYFTWTRKYWRI